MYIGDPNASVIFLFDFGKKSGILKYNQEENMSNVVKTAVSLPREYFLKLEHLRRNRKESRSRIITEAIETWFRLSEEKEMEQQYRQGYLKKPEGKPDHEILFKIGLASWTKEEW